jgi:hypothetical protein
MGGNKKPEQQQTGYGPNAGQSSSSDPRGRMQNQGNYQQSRYESQQGPLADAMSYNYGRSSEADYGNYTDMMNQYRDIASNGGGGGMSGGGGGGGGAASNYSAFTVNPERVGVERAGVERAANRQLNPLERTTAQTMGPINQVSARQSNPIERVQASNPFESYGGFKEFGQTGGYSGQDIANMRARGMAPIRAAYGNAERAVGQQRSLQGGYSPNAIAAQVKMAREQGQGMADAATNVEAGIAQARNQGRLSGYQGMAGIEGNRLNAQMQGDIYNSGAAQNQNQFDIGNELNANQYNTTNQFNARQFDVGNDLQNQQFNSNQAFQGNQFDVSNDMNTSQFNAGQGNQVGMFNAGQGNQMGQFNADLDFRGQQYNADAYTQAEARNNASAEAAASRSAAASQDNTRNRLAALEGMNNVYGTTPGASQLFGNQAANIVGQGGTYGLDLMQEERMGQALPGQYDQTMGRARDIAGTVGQYATPLLDYFGNRNQQSQTQQRYPSNYGGQQTNPQISNSNFGRNYQTPQFNQPSIYTGGIGPSQSGYQGVRI